MLHRSFRSSSFGSRLLGVALCAASAGAGCSNSDTPAPGTTTGGSGNSPGAGGSVAQTSGGSATTVGGSGGQAGSVAASGGTVGAGVGGSSGANAVGGTSPGTGGTATSTGGTGGSATGTGGSATGGGGAAASGGSGGQTAHTGPWKIMPLGDSTTASVCYRPLLWGKLQTAGKTNIDFVGTEHNVSCATVPANFDQDNEGHPCYIVSNLVNQGVKPSCTSDFKSDSTDLALWFNNQSPDIVLMHFGTNDIWNGFAPTNILAAYTAILTKLRTRNPNVKMFVAQIIPLKPDAAKDYDALTKALNNAIPGWAAANTTTASPVVVVDQFTGYDATVDNQYNPPGDVYVHPNATGSEKIAQKWFTAIQGLL